MRYLFASAQLAAHLDWGGFLATAQELTRRGHDVLWVSGDAVAPIVRHRMVAFHAVAETGWRWPPPPPLLRMPDQPGAEFEKARAQRSLDQWLDVQRVSTAVELLTPIVAEFRPDVVVSEVFVTAAALCAERSNTPFVVVGWPAYATAAAAAAGLEDARARLVTLCDRFALSGLNFTTQGPPSVQSAHMHITFWSEAWFAGTPLASQTRHCGGRASPGAAPDPSLPSPNERPWVWITLGTTFGDDPRFFRRAAQAAHNLGCLPIVSTGNARQRDWIRDLPPETVVTERIDFATVLPWTSAAIHHGGAGTTHALVTHAVPQIVVPHAGDQARQAAGVRRTGVGAALAPRDATMERLTEWLAAALPDQSPFRQNAMRLREDFTALGGVDSAAHLLEALPRSLK